MSRSTARLWLMLLLAASFLLSAFPIWWGLPDNHGWAFDEIRPGHVLRPAEWPAKYPPLHRHLLRAVYLPVTALESIGVLDSDPSSLYFIYFIVGRALSVILATAAVYAVYRAGRVVSDRAGALFAAACVAFSPTFVYYAKTANLEMPYFFWTAWALLFYLRSLRDRRVRDFVGFAVCGIFSIGAKDPVWAFWVITPLILAAFLSVQRSTGRFLPTYLKSFVDRRMLAASAAALVAFGMVYRVWSGSDELWRHVQTITSPAYEEVRNFPATIVGHLEMAVQTVLNVQFILGGPALVAAAVGLCFAVARPRRHRLAIMLLPPVAVYLVLFIHWIGFNYDRHLLPVSLVAAIFGGVCVTAVGERWRAQRRIVVALGVAVLAFSFSRTLATDFLMLGDPRYATEAWVRSQLGKSVVGLGANTMLPRNVRAVSGRRFRPETVGESRMLPGGWHDCLELRWLEADYLIPSFPGVFESPGIGYREALRFENRFAWSLSQTGRALTNLDKIPRSVRVYEPTPEPCTERKPILRLLQLLDRGSEEVTEASFLNAVEDAGDEVRKVSLGPGVSGIGMQFNGWTRGTEPAAIIVRNEGQYPMAAVVSVESQAPLALHPFSLRLRDGPRTDEVRFEAPGSQDVRLPEVGPGSLRAFTVAVDREWKRDRPYSHLAGVRFSAVSDFEPLKTLFEDLEVLRESRDPRMRAELTERILTDSALPARDLAAGTQALGLLFNGWTRGTWPAAVVLTNLDSSARVPRLRIRARPSRASSPVTAFLDDGGLRRELVFYDNVPQTINLSPVPPGSTQLVILKSDKAVAAPHAAGRAIGVKLVSVEWVAPSS